MILFCLIVAAIVSLSGSAFACDSDCYQCHNNIPADKDHAAIKTCTKCHPEHPVRKKDDKCGADCFECHPVDNVVSTAKEHEVLKGCIKCHKSLKHQDLKDIFGDLR